MVLLRVKDEINGEINIQALDFLLENWVFITISIFMVFIY